MEVLDSSTGSCCDVASGNSGIDTWGSTGGEDRVGSHDGDSSTAVDVSSDCSGCDVAGGNGGIGKQGNTGG